MSSDKINFDPSIFTHHLSVVISDLDSVNNADFEGFFHEFKLAGSNLKVKFETFVMPHTEDTIISDYLTTSYFLKDIIETSSRKIRSKLKDILTSFDKDSS